MSLNNKALIYASMAVFFWSTVATAFKIALQELDFIQLIFIASGVTSVLLFIILLIQGKTGLIRKTSRREWFRSVLAGAFNPLLYYLVLLRAYSLLPAQIAQPLNMIWPIVLVLLSVPFLHQQIGWKSLVALLISFTGVVVISSQGEIMGFRETSIEGVLLATGSSVLWSAYWIFNVLDKRDEILKLFLNFAFGFIFLGIAVFLFSDFRMTLGRGMLAAVYTGIFEAGITYVLWLKAMQLSTNHARIGNLVFFAPFLSLIFIRNNDIP